MLNFKKRVREIPAKSSSLSGMINIGQTQKSIQFESSLERDYIYLLEFNWEVHQYLEQPLEIIYVDKSGKKRKYTPDFVVSFVTQRPNEIIEIKYESTLKIKEEELKEKFKAAENFCKKNGFVFKVITEKYIREEKGVELENYKFLLRYRDFFSNVNKKETAFPGINIDVGILHDTIMQVKKTTVRELVDMCAQDEDKKAELIFLTWFLIATKLIKTNLSEKLNLNSIIWHD